MNDGWVLDAQVGDRLLLHDIRAVVEAVAPDQSWVDLVLWWEHDFWFERRMLPIGPYARRVHRWAFVHPPSDWGQWTCLYQAAMEWLAGRA